MKMPKRLALRAALPQANEGAVAATRRPNDPHRQQTVIVQGLDSAQHAAMHAKVLKHLPQQVALDFVVCRFQVHKAEMKQRSGMSVLV